MTSLTIGSEDVLGREGHVAITLNDVMLIALAV